MSLYGGSFPDEAQDYRFHIGSRSFHREDAEFAESCGYSLRSLRLGGEMPTCSVAYLKTTGRYTLYPTASVVKLQITGVFKVAPVASFTPLISTVYVVEPSSG